MKTIYAHLDIGYANACHDDELEVEDDATDEQIGALVKDWADNYIDTCWSEEKPTRRH
jgi:hypothetical protein